MTHDIDWTRLQPLRMALGKHAPNSGYGCAMEVISWITGDEFTDKPKCAHPALARLVQNVNDMFGQTRGQEGNAAYEKLLSPDDAIEAIELGMLTIGTEGCYIKPRLVHQLENLLNALAEVTMQELSEGGAEEKIYEVANNARRILLEIREDNNLGDTPEINASAVAELVK